MGMEFQHLQSPTISCQALRFQGLERIAPGLDHGARSKFFNGRIITDVQVVST